MIIPELTNPKESVRICAVDPGTSHLGLAVLDWVWGSDLATVIWAKTIHATDDTHDNTYSEKVGRRDKRLAELEETFREFIQISNPTFIISETPFFNRRTPSAFESGVELQYMLRHSLWDYYPTKTLYGVDPMAVKRHVGVNPKGTTKDDMQKAVIGLYKNSTLIDLKSVDEHSIDAIAVGNYFVRTSLLNLNQLLPVSTKKFVKKFRRRRRRKK